MIHSCTQVRLDIRAFVVRTLSNAQRYKHKIELLGVGIQAEKLEEFFSFLYKRAIDTTTKKFIRYSEKSEATASVVRGNQFSFPQQQRPLRLKVNALRSWISAPQHAESFSLRIPTGTQQYLWPPSLWSSLCPLVVVYRSVEWDWWDRGRSSDDQESLRDKNAFLEQIRKNLIPQIQRSVSPKLNKENSHAVGNVCSPEQTLFGAMNLNRPIVMTTESYY